MSTHWRIAIRYAVCVCAGAVVVGAGIWLLYGALYAGAFVYGVAMALLSFISMAVTVSLMAGRSTGAMIAVGAGSFGARCVFAAVVLGIPAYLGLLPIFAMLCGFGAVYLAETVALLPMMPKKISSPVEMSSGENTEHEKEERKVST